MGTLEPQDDLNPESLPNFWDSLSEKDKVDYKMLKATLDACSSKRNRGHRTEAFDKIMESIRMYAEKGDEDDWRRFLVCGVCWMDNMIAINTRQLRLLISKCKSSINGSFQKLGYTTNQSHTESWKFLFDRIPLLKDNFSELRQWTIRCKNMDKSISVYPVQDSGLARADSERNIPQPPFTPVQNYFLVPQQIIEQLGLPVAQANQPVAVLAQIESSEKKAKPEAYCPPKFRTKMLRQNSFDLR